MSFVPVASLQLIPLEALLSEVYSRFDAAVFAGLRNLGDSEQAEYGYAGGTFTGEALALALADYLKHCRYCHQMVDGEGEAQAEDDT